VTPTTRRRPPKPYHSRSGIDLYHGDCRDVLPRLAQGSCAAVVTDPPYGLGIGGRTWDDDVAFYRETWRAVAQALAPGAPLLAFGGTRTWHRLAMAVELAGYTIGDSLAWLYGEGRPSSQNRLKPAWEPILLAWLGRRCNPLGIDGCRVPGEPRPLVVDRKSIARKGRTYNGGISSGRRVGLTEKGRWPANAVHDGSSAVLAAIGPGARFLYQAKARHPKQRGADNDHPTVKPLPLMDWLVRLACPEGGTVLDPFAGSGTNMVAAALAGRRAVGIEQSEEYCEIAARRIDALADVAA